MEEIILWLEMLVEGLAAAIILVGILETTGKSLVAWFKSGRLSPNSKDIRLNLGRWLVLALEFLLAADILSTVMNPNWNDIAQLAAVATIRTALNYFLEREIRTEESAHA